MIRSRPAVFVVLVLLASLVPGLVGAEGTSGPSDPQIELLPVPRPVLEAMGSGVRDELAAAWDRLEAAETRVRERDGAERDAARAELAEAFGAVGRLARTYRLSASADAALRNAGTLVPDDLRWPYLLGVLAQEERRLADAAAAFDRVLALDPGALAARLRRAEVARLLGDETAAQEGFAVALSDPEGEAAARWGLARLAVDRGDDREALPHLEWLAARRPGATAVQQVLGLALRRLGETGRAARHLERAGPVGVGFPDPLVDAAAPAGAGAAMLQGRLALRAGRVEDAVRLLREAVAADPTSASAHRDLAVALERSGDADTAVAAAAEAARLEPDLPRSWYELGRLRLTLGADPDGAIEALERALELAPDYPEALRTLGAARLARGETGAARRALERVAELDPDPTSRAAVLETLGDLEQADGRPEVAVERYGEALRADPDRPVAHFNRGLLLARSGRPAEARRHFERAVALRPDDREARWLLARLALAAGDEAAALAVLEEAPSAGEGAPPDVRLRHLLARVLACADPAPAVADAERALSLAHEALAAVATLEHAVTVGMALAAAGRHEEAVAWQQQLVEQALASGLSVDRRTALEGDLARYRAGERAVPPWRR